MQGHQINSEDKTVHHQTIKTNPIQSLKREQRTMVMRIFVIQVHDPVIHLEVDEEQYYWSVPSVVESHNFLSRFGSLLV